jgi:hypothetical protein
MIRPSYRELNKKLKEGKAAKVSGRVYFVEPRVLYADLLELDLTVGDFQALLGRIFEEIRPSDYDGRRPPDRSYEKSVLNCELFAFSWDSGLFGCRMYLKFVLKREELWIISFHKSKKRGEYE